ncbi:thioredoxin family protein [Candidatus Hodarchaeum mangrovi]
MIERITKEFYETGLTFEEFVREGTTDEKDRMMLYYRKSERKFEKHELQIDNKNQINLLVVAATWCWDTQTNIPILAKIAENSPNISMKIFNKNKYPFLITQVNGGEKVPQVLVFTKDFYYIDRWVERTTKAYQLYGQLREELGWKIDKSDFSKEFRKKYLKIQKEIEESFIEEIRRILIRADAIQMSTLRFAEEIC